MAAVPGGIISSIPRVSGPQRTSSAEKPAPAAAPARLGPRPLRCSEGA